MTAGLTIIVLTRNRRELLRGCLASLFAQEDPGLPLEFIVIDDGSLDGSAEMARRLTASRPEWRIVTQAPAGVAAARNAGIRRCRTDWLAFVADDYVLPAGYAREVAEFFRQRPQALAVRFRVVAAPGRGYVAGVLAAHREAGQLRRAHPGRLTWRRLRPAATASTDHLLEAAGAAAFRADVFDRLGGFDESYERGEDSEFTGRLRQAGIAVHCLPRPCIVHREETRLGAALRKAYAGGRASWRLGAGERGPLSGAAVARVGLRSLAAIPFWTCWRARQAGILRGLFYLPALLLVEAAARAGYFAACLDRRRPGAEGS